MATRSDESMKHADENLQQDGLPMGDHLGETANGGADGGSKRGVPQSTEKVSPEKKVMRKDLPSPPIEPRRLELGVTGDDGDDKITKITESLEAPPALPQVQPSPVPAPTETSQPEPALAREDLVASLTKALEKIAKLELEVEKQKQQKQVEPTVAEVTPLRGCAAGTPSSAVTSKPGGGDEGSDDSDGNESSKGAGDIDLLKFPNGQQLMSHDALRMRLRRLCEVKPKTNKCHVDSETCEQYKRGGEGREWLEIALIEALQKVGPDSRQHKKLRVPHL